MKLSKILCAIFALIIMISASVVAVAEDDEIVILYTNDVHTYIDGELTYSKIAALKKSYTNAILVDAGDHIQGTAFGSMDKGATIVKLMNAAGYDVATLGNHEFDYGMSGCLDTISRAEYTYVSCNFHHEKDGVIGDNVLEPYKIIEKDGVKIAFIGITTPETFTKSTPIYFQDENGNFIYGIIGGEDGKALYERVQTTIDKAKTEADFVIALGHLGVDPSSQPWTSKEVIQNISGLDAFIDGHSHTTIACEKVADKDGNQVILTQTGQYFENVGKLTISNGEIKTELIASSSLTDASKDAGVLAIEEKWKNEIDEKLGAVIGKTDVVFDNYDENGNRLVRKQSTNTGDFTADAFYYLFDNMGIDVDMSIVNGGGIRNKTVTGDITYLTCKEIHPFCNVACIIKVTGQQILDALEWGAREVSEISESGSFFHTAGVTYKVDISIEETTQKDDKGVWIGGPTGEYRVYDVKVYNKKTNEWDALDPKKTYNLAGYNYTLRDLGSGCSMFQGAENILDYVMEDYMVLANYIQGFENNTIHATNSPLSQKYEGLNIDYSSVYGSGRIVFEPKPTDIPSPEDNNATATFTVVAVACALILLSIAKKHKAK